MAVVIPSGAKKKKGAKAKAKTKDKAEKKVAKVAKKKAKFKTLGPRQQAKYDASGENRKGGKGPSVSK